MAPLVREADANGRIISAMTDERSKRSFPGGSIEHAERP